MQDASRPRSAQAMNRYATLIEEYKKSFEGYQAYLDKCRKFCAKYMDGLVEFLECPKDRVVPMVRGKEGKYEVAPPGEGYVNEKGYFVNIFVILIPIDNADLTKKPELKAICRLEVKSAAGEGMEMRLECLGDSLHQKVNEANMKATYVELVNSITQTLQHQHRYLIVGNNPRRLF
jgi:hypothetical protein